jgi:hypothetical protein
VRRIPVAVAVGVLTLLVWCQPAAAHVGTVGTGSRAMPVTSGQPLTVTGAAAVFSNGAKTNDPPIAVTATLSNPNPFHRWAHKVTATFGSSDKNGCTAASYQINGSPQNVGRTVPRGTGTVTVTGLTVGLVNGSCKGSTVTLSYSVT